MSLPTILGYKEVDNHSTAFAVYTSGTTGNPKGVIHEYGNIDRIIKSFDKLIVERFSIGDHKISIMATLSFIAIETFACLSIYSESSLYIIPYDIAKNPVLLKKHLYDNKITAAIFTSSILKVLDIKTPYIRDVFTIAEPAYDIEVDGYTLHNTYAMSETGFVMLSYSTTKTEKVVPTGKPLFDLNIKLMGENEEGDVGEIVVEDPYVRGYINRPIENKKAFKNGWLYTGDLARKLPNGDYVILGRIDDMVKINGNRVEPSEIESVAKMVLDIDTAIVKFVKRNDKTLVCLYYIDDIKIDEEETRKAMANYLPQYMLPSYFIHIDALPISINGKVQRRLLY